MASSIAKRLAKTVALAYVDVPLPELGDDVVVRVKEMTAGQREAYDESMMEEKDGKLRANSKGFRSKLVFATCVDAKDGRPFADTLDEVRAIKSSVLNKLYDTAIELNKLGEEGVVEAGKDSTAPANDPSASPSPANSDAQSPS